MTSKLYATLGVNWVRAESSEVGASTPVAKAVMVGSAVSEGARPRSIVRTPWVVLPPPEPVSGRDGIGSRRAERNMLRCRGVTLVADLSVNRARNHGGTRDDPAGAGLGTGKHKAADQGAEPDIVDWTHLTLRDDCFKHDMRTRHSANLFPSLRLFFQHDDAAYPA